MAGTRQESVRAAMTTPWRAGMSAALLGLDRRVLCASTRSDSRPIPARDRGRSTWQRRRRRSVAAAKTSKRATRRRPSAQARRRLSRPRPSAMSRPRIRGTPNGAQVWTARWEATQRATADRRSDALRLRAGLACGYVVRTRPGGSGRACCGSRRPDHLRAPLEATDQTVCTFTASGPLGPCSASCERGRCWSDNYGRGHCFARQTARRDARESTAVGRRPLPQRARRPIDTES